MLKLLFSSFFYFCLLLCNAQQTVFIEKISNGNLKSVKLPAVVHIIFKNIGYKELLLERVSNDSFFFKKYYNQPENYDCALSNISDVNFPKKSDFIVQSAFTFFTSMSLFLTPLTIGGFFHQSTDAGDPTKFLAIFFGIPISAISIITSVALINKLPKSFSTKKWRIYVK